MFEFGIDDLPKIFKEKKMFLCRDGDGCLHLLIGHHYPYKGVYEGIEVWRMCDEFFAVDDIDLNRNLYTEVTFENSPQEVELKLIEK
jgi:hypothetical protein